MPALDFPTSPTNGQIYGQYTYDSTKGAWRVTSPSTVNNAIISPTAPPSPVAGNIWYNSTDGNTYVYYNDGDTSQWVQLKSDATLSSTLGNRVTLLESYPSGLVPIVPTSVAVGSGSGSVASNGVVTFTGATSIALNSIFSATYTNYVLLWNTTSGSSDNGMLAYFRSGTTNDTTASYNYVYYESSGGALVASGGASQTSMRLGRSSGTGGGGGIVEIFAPYLSGNPSRAVGRSMDGAYFGQGAGVWGPSKSHDGFTLTTGSAVTLTGTLQVYGYRK